MELKTDKKYCFLSGSMLKLIAVVSMLIDHIAAILLCTMRDEVAYVLPENMLLYKLMRGIGRISFPIYCFLLVEGFLHTHDRKKYGINLFLFALISELPYDLAFYGEMTMGHQNVFFTLLLGFLAMCCFERFRGEWRKQTGCLLVLLGVAYCLNASYGLDGYGFILLMYGLRNEKLLQAVAGCCLHPNTWKAGLAFIPINLYNGERGFIKGKAMKYAFYAFYPVHLTVLYFIKVSGI